MFPVKPRIVPVTVARFTRASLAVGACLLLGGRSVASELAQPAHPTLQAPAADLIDRRRKPRGSSKTPTLRDPRGRRLRWRWRYRAMSSGRRNLQETSRTTPGKPKFTSRLWSRRYVVRIWSARWQRRRRSARTTRSVRRFSKSRWAMSAREICLGRSRLWPRPGSLASASISVGWLLESRVFKRRSATFRARRGRCLPRLAI